MIIYKLKKYIKKSCNSFIFVLYNHVVFTCGAIDIYLRWAEMFMPDGMGCIPPVVSPTLGGSSLCLPPVAPADVPAITAQDLGHLPAVLLDYSRIVLNFRSGVMCRAIAPLRFLDEK